VRIADFGMSKITGKHEADFVTLIANQVGGTPLYMAPELLPGAATIAAPDEKCDVFSYGVLAWETFVQKVPYPSAAKANVATLAAEIRKGTRPNKDVTDPITEMVSVRQFLDDCWDTDPNKRHSFAVFSSDEDENSPWKKILAEELSQHSKLTKDFWEACLGDFKKSEHSKTTTDHNVAEWNNFLMQFNKTFSVDLSDKDKRALQIILEVDEESKPKIVTAAQWDNFVQWFGPFETGQAMKKVQILQNILAEPWFFGAMSSTDAEYRLCFEKPGTFLVRYSSQKSWFTISWVEKDKSTKTDVIRHYRLVRKAELLLHCVNFHLKHNLKNPKPCPERPSKFRLDTGKAK